MLRLPAFATLRAGRILLWGVAPPFSAEALRGILLRRGEEILAPGPVEVALAFPEWTQPRRVIPHQVRMERGGVIRAPWVTLWLARFGYEEPRAELAGMTPEGERVELLVRDLDLDAVEAYVAAPTWQRCAGGVWVEAGPALQIRPDSEEDWAAAWLERMLPPPVAQVLEGLRQEAARRGMPWPVLYRARENRFDGESRRQIEEMLLLARALRRHRLTLPQLEALAEAPLDL
jgi:hypothetical protein